MDRLVDANHDSTSWDRDAQGRVIKETRADGTFSQTGGLYQVEVDKPRTSTERDVTQVAAQRSYSEGERLRVEEKAESLRRAIDKYEKALSLRREAGDRRQEALTLTAIGEVYGNLGERQKALGYYNSALPLLRGIGDGGEVATTLNYLGDVSYYLGDKQRALDFHRRTGVACAGLVRKVS